MKFCTAYVKLISNSISFMKIFGCRHGDRVFDCLVKEWGASSRLILSLYFVL